MNNEDNNNANREQIRRQIAQLSQDLTALSQRLERLIIAEAEGAGQPAPQAEDFVIGDQVVITNNYRGQRGLRGTIVTITPRTVSLRLQGQDRVLTKRKENVRRIQEQ